MPLTNSPPCPISKYIYKITNNTSKGFFFANRRRHTSYIGDWSSDVCSSDPMQGREPVPAPRHGDEEEHRERADEVEHGAEVPLARCPGERGERDQAGPDGALGEHREPEDRKSVV